MVLQLLDVVHLRDGHVAWIAQSQDALEALVNQGKPVAALQEVWSHPSQVYQPEPEQHEQAVEEVGAALGYGVGHDPHRITPEFSRSRSAPKLPPVGSTKPGGKRRTTAFRRVCHRMGYSSLR